jgi:hypothetical protein
MAFLLVTSAANAQPPEMVPAVVPEETREVHQLNAPAADFQRDALNRLEARARALAGNDEAKFTMLLREGLKRLPSLVETKERGGITPPVDAVIDSLNTIARAPTEDERDPELQAAVKRNMEQARQFGTRMVGASPVPLGARLDTVAILNSSEQTGCSGVVIAPGAVLTAAHCVCDFDLAESRRRIAFGNNATSPSAVAFSKPTGTRIFPSTTTLSTFCVDFKKFAVKGIGKVCHRDIALLRFDSASTPKNLAIAKFASKGEVDSAFAKVKSVQQPPWMQVVGFGVAGIVSENGILVFRGAGEKRVGVFNFYSDCPTGTKLDCASSASGSCFGNAEILIRDMKHADFPTDSCGGDSGGPAYLQDSSNQWRLAGLVSRASGEGCGPGGFYSSIYHADVLKWLHDNEVPGF